MRRLATLALVLLLQPGLHAATRLEIPGGWYGEAQPSGAYAVALTGGPVVTNHGTIPAPLPGDRPLYLRLSPDGSAFAGQSQEGRGTWEFVGGGWTLRDNPAFGVSGAIYDLLGVLRFAVPGVTGSQGFRYAEDDTNRLVTGDETYYDPSHRLFEWTRHGEVAIGQGDTGCVAVTDTDMSVNGVRVQDRRLIEFGDCRFVRFNRTGDVLAVAMVKLLEHKTVLLWLTVDELRQFPIDQPPVKLPVDPSAQGAPDDSAVAAAEAARHPELLAAMRSGSDACDARRAQGLSTEQCEGEVNALKGRMDGFIGVAVHRVHPEWGQRRKDAGAHYQRADGVNVATDVLMWKPDGQIVDVVSDRGTGWSLNPADHQPVDQWVLPLAEPDAPPPPPGDDVTALKAQVADLQRRLAQAVLNEAAANAARQQTEQLARQLQEELDRVNADLTQTVVDRDTAREQVQQLQRQLDNVGCEAKVPGILKALGIKVGCVVKK